MRTIVWFRGKDLRVNDHLPLAEAAAAGDVIPLFVLDPYFFAPERAQRTPHRIQFLLESLRELEQRISELGSRLLILQGKSVEVVPELARRCNVERVLAQRWVAPVGRERDRRIATLLEGRFRTLDGETLLPPGTLRNQSGAPFSVFTPFARAFGRAGKILPPLARIASLPPLPHDVTEKVATVSIPSCRELGISENPALLRGGEAAAEERLGAFLHGAGRHYEVDRDRMDLPGTSRLSADLKFGTLSIRSVWHKTRQLPPAARAACTNELLWREFAHSTLWDRPELLEEPFRSEFSGFPWLEDRAGWQAWVEGRTGYPLVDAAARQLLAEGFVHNRARMVAASFLSKHLLIDYRRGEAHYMRFLTDGDWAQNNAGWQWAAGTGSDAQPYFRIFNPVAQGTKFDPEGNYVRRWVPELAKLPARHIHAPWTAPPSVLEPAGVRLGVDYPAPIVEHAAARERFLRVAREHFGSQRFG